MSLPKKNGKSSLAVLNLCLLNRSTIGVAHTPLIMSNSSKHAKGILHNRNQSRVSKSS